MIKLAAILLFTVLLLSVSSISYMKKAIAAGECPAGQAKDWAGVCYPLKECKASMFAQPGTCTQAEKYAGCPSGQIKDWAGICFKESEAKACPTCAPGSAAAAEKPNTGMLTGALQIKKPATSTNPVSENCLQTTTRSGEPLCLTKGTLTPATTPNKEAEKPVPELNCNGPAGTTNGIGSLYIGHSYNNETGKCEMSLGLRGPH
jgi:hypothetical protein